MAFSHGLVDKPMTVDCVGAPLLFFKPGILTLPLLLDPPFWKCRRSMQRRSLLRAVGSILRALVIFNDLQLMCLLLHPH